MNQWLKDIRDFHEKFGIEYNGKPRALPENLRHFRTQFKQEELDEYSDHGTALSVLLDPNVPAPEADRAEITHQLEGQLDALVDLMYVTLGSVYLQGFGPIFDEAWNRVHAANMAKVRAQADASDSKRGSSFDVVKPPGWAPPSHTDLVEDHVHEG